MIPLFPDHTETLLLHRLGWHSAIDAVHCMPWQSTETLLLASLIYSVAVENQAYLTTGHGCVFQKLRQYTTSQKVYTYSHFIEPIQYLFWHIHKSICEVK